MEKKDMVPVGTKVSPEAKQRFAAICKKFGFSEYDALQMFIDMLIRMADDQTNLSYEMARMVQLLDGIKDWRFSMRITDDEKRMFINEAFYVLTGQEHTEGAKLLHVTGKAGYRHRKETYNVQEMLERFISIVMPNAYRRLRMLGVDIGTNSIYETITRIVDEYKVDKDREELILTFSDNDWDHGYKVGEHVKTKRTRNNNPELFQ